MCVFWCKIDIHFMKDLDKGCLFVRGQFWDVLQQNLLVIMPSNSLNAFEPLKKVMQRVRL